MKRLVISVVLAVALVIVPASGVLAGTTAGVEITATPSFMGMTNSIATWGAGTVTENGTFWSSGTEPAGGTLIDDDCFSLITNTGSVDVKIQIESTAFSGGVNWAFHADTVGEDIVVLKAGASGTDVASMIAIAVAATKYDLIATLPHSALNTKKWEMSLDTGTFTDTVLKTANVTLTAATP